MRLALLPQRDGNADEDAGVGDIGDNSRSGWDAFWRFRGGFCAYISTIWPWKDFVRSGIAYGD